MVLKGWYTCPTCRRRLAKVLPETVVYMAPVYCRKCRVEWFPAIWRGRELAADEPFPLAGN